MQSSLKELVSKLWIIDDGPGGWFPRTDRIDLDELRCWMQSDDLEVLGHLNYVLADPRFNVMPPLSISEYIEFAKRYYSRCLNEDSDGEWADNRYEAGWSIATWFFKLWDDKQVPRSAVADIKSWLGELYKAGDASIRRCIVNATLEHLFERRDVKKYFADWQTDPSLKGAYRDASLWGGKTPLSD